MLDAQLLRESERRQAINDAEINGLRGAAVFRRLRERSDAENLLCRARMDVFAIPERVDQHGIFRKVRHDAQFDLRVVGGEQYVALFCHKSSANFAAQLRSNGNILQIRIAGAQPARGRPGLRKTRVQPTRLRMNQFRQRVHIG